MLLCRCALLAVATLAFVSANAEQTAAVKTEKVSSFAVPEARQAVAVDARHFYAIDNRIIAKYDKRTGERVGEWAGPAEGPIIHLDSGAIVDGKLYAAHSNYPGWPMVSSVGIWDARTLTHIGTHSFDIDWGSLTWLDFHDGAWWGAFANYSWPFGGSLFASGNNRNTQIVRFDAEWRVAEAWVLPEALLEKFGDMSNSGGSRPDGQLWITGHDKPEAYALMPPEAGSMLRWTATASLDIAGQGIARDRSDRQVIWGVVRDAKGGNRVTASRVDLP